jgi:DNA polymerase-3 subunit delta
VSSPAADSVDKPTVYLLYGDDDFGIEQDLARFTEPFADPVTADMNRTVLDGTSLDFGDLAGAAQSMPFLADRRLVIVDNAGRLVKAREGRDRLLALFDDLPATTGLVLIERLDLSRRDSLAKYEANSSLLAWTKEHKSRGWSKAYPRPQGPAFVTWLIARCRELGGEIEGAAAQVLGELVADDAYLGNQELHKLLDYVDYGRPIEVGDVERLTPRYGQGDIFGLVDSVGARDARAALAHLHRLLQDEDPRPVFGMIIRQFRLLLQAREALDAGQRPEQTMSVHAFVAGKAATQARNFRLPQLEAVYHQLLDLDIASKTGRADLLTGIHQLIVQLAR